MDDLVEIHDLESRVSWKFLSSVDIPPNQIENLIIQYGEKVYRDILLSLDRKVGGNAEHRMQWLRTPHKDLNMATPLSVLTTGNPHKALHVLDRTGRSHDNSTYAP